MNAAPSTRLRAEPRSASPRVVGTFLRRYYLQVAVVVLLVVFCVAVPNFGSQANFANIAQQASFAGIVACGMTLLIAGGLFDLSVAGVTAVSAIATALVLPYTTIGAAVLTGVVTGGVLGLINGVVVTKIRIPPFIATFGMFNIYVAIAFIMTKGSILPISSINFQALASVTVGPAPGIFVVFVAVCLASYGLLYRTRLGRQLRAVGSNEQAAQMAGISVDRVKIAAFVVTGLLTGISAVGLAALLSSAAGNMAIGVELNAITIAVVGGTALRGGEGRMLGTFTGAVFITAVNSALNLTGVSSYWQSVSVGLILVLTLIVGALTAGRTTVRGA
jgi:ribose/xylose/arabinose/galactoside ABC-type transport system permease subunit